jgi:hypothetical protein
MSEQRVSDLVFRPVAPGDRPPVGDEAWQAALRAELTKLRRRARPAPRVVPVAPRRDGVRAR